MSSVRAVLSLLLTLIVGCAAAEPAPEPPVGKVTQAITNGASDTSDAAVVALLAKGEVYCSGTLIASDVVVTAAHCVTPQAPDHVFFGSNPKGASGTALGEVALVKVHSEYDAEELTNDIAVVILADDAPVVPIERVAALTDDDYEGLELRIVGFGATTGSQDTFKALKHEGKTKVATVADSSFKLVPSPSQTCKGDSGGPAFATVHGKEVLVGVTSAGDSDCVAYGRDMRIDAYGAFIDQATARSASSGCASAPMKTSGFRVLPLLAVFLLRRRRWTGTI